MTNTIPAVSSYTWTPKTYPIEAVVICLRGPSLDALVVAAEEHAAVLGGTAKPVRLNPISNHGGVCHYTFSVQPTVKNARKVYRTALAALREVNPSSGI